jgi:histidine triad (HIT) family protein
MEDRGASSECVFCRIVRGDVPAHEVCRGGAVVAFLDHRPLFEGHVLVVPTVHHVTLADLPAEELGGFFAAVQRISARLPEALGCRGTLVVMNNLVSQSVPHLHAHVVPRTKGDGLRGFFWPRTRYADDAAAASVAARIAASLE